VARYMQIQRLRQNGYNIAQIVRMLNLHPKTVRINSRATSFPEKPFEKERRRNSC
jgi:DNA-binding transcriptional MerR regulator